MLSHDPLHPLAPRLRKLSQPKNYWHQTCQALGHVVDFVLDSQIKDLALAESINGYPCATKSGRRSDHESLV